MKFCKDCKFHLPSLTAIEELRARADFTRCAQVPDHGLYLVTGDPSDVRYGYASTQRMPGAPCGPDALLYEEAPLPTTLTDFHLDLLRQMETEDEH